MKLITNQQMLHQPVGLHGDGGLDLALRIWAGSESRRGVGSTAGHDEQDGHDHAESEAEEGHHGNGERTAKAEDRTAFEEMRRVLEDIYHHISQPDGRIYGAGHIFEEDEEYEKCHVCKQIKTGVNAEI